MEIPADITRLLNLFNQTALGAVGFSIWRDGNSLEVEYLLPDGTALLVRVPITNNKVDSAVTEAARSAQQSAERLQKFGRR